jgi:hypothetical protein
VVSHIKNPDLEYKDWEDIVIAIYATTGGLPDGLKILDTFSRKSI